MRARSALFDVYGDHLAGEPVTLDGGRGYRATARGVRRLDDAAARIYRRAERPWDGRWRMLLVTESLPRQTRDRLPAELGWLGHAVLGERLWVSPHPSAGLAEVLARLGVRAVTWTADELDPTGPLLAAWDLPPRWPGIEARRRFTDAAARLRPGSDRFAARCLDPGWSTRG